MKKTAMLVVLVIALLGAFTATTAGAEMRMETGKSGKIYVSEGEPRRLLTAVEEQAIKNPGKEIPVDLHPVQMERKFFYITPVQEYTQVVVYDPGKQTIITAEKKGKVYGEKEFVWHIVLFIIAIAAMVVSDTLFKLEEDVPLFTAIAAFVAYAFTVFAALVAYATYATDYVPIVFFSILPYYAAISIIYVARNFEKRHKPFSVIFYIVVGIAMFV